MMGRGWIHVLVAATALAWPVGVAAHLQLNTTAALPTLNGEQRVEWNLPVSNSTVLDVNQGYAFPIVVTNASYIMIGNNAAVNATPTGLHIKSTLYWPPNATGFVLSAALVNEKTYQLWQKINVSPFDGLLVIPPYNAQSLPHDVQHYQSFLGLAVTSWEFDLMWSYLPSYTVNPVYLVLWNNGGSQVPDQMVSISISSAQLAFITTNSLPTLPPPPSPPPPSSAQLVRAPRSLLLSAALGAFAFLLSMLCLA